MKATSKVLVILGLLVGSSICALAGNITWTLEDVYFSNGNTATGYFITDHNLNLLSYSLEVTGPDLAQAFTATVFVTSYLPDEVGFANSDFSKYVNLNLASPITYAGGIIPMIQGLFGSNDCGGGGGCGTLLIGDGYDPTLDGVVPEPASLVVLGSSLAILGTMLRRKLSRALGADSFRISPAALWTPIARRRVGGF